MGQFQTQWAATSASRHKSRYSNVWICGEDRSAFGLAANPGLVQRTPPAMKVCFFNRSYWPDFGATGQLLTDLAEDLVRHHGCEVSVVAGLPLTNDARKKLLFVPVRQEWHNGVHILRALGTTWRNERFAGRAANYISYSVSACIAAFRMRRADVVVSLTDPPIIGLVALLAARRCGARFVFLCQDMFPEVARLLEGLHSSIVERFLEWVSRFLLARADLVIAIGETMRDRLIRTKGADPRKIVVIHNWADCEQIVPGSKQNAFSLTHGFADSFIVMHSGNIGLSQDLDTLLDVAHLLRPYPDIVIAIIGDGARRAALEARVRVAQLSSVRFLPYQARADLSQSFAAADVFIISLKQGLSGCIVPSKVYGILASGRPYVAAVESASEVAAITNDFACGLIAEPGNAREIAEKVLRLYRDRTLGQRLGANGRRAALSFDRRRQIRAYRNVFLELASKPRGRQEGQLVKRCFDMLIAGLGLLASSPIWVLIAIAIKLCDRGPIFYSQERVGQGGRRFRSWKFRSMVINSDELFGALQARDGDPRITRVGRLLRATAMDELPQLWNILRGDMSFVGPRPLLPEEIETNGDGQLTHVEKIPGYEARHRVKPGLTGVAQIYAERDIPRRSKFRYDLLYIRKRSFLLDFRLIVLSFWITLRGRWEHRGRKF